MKFQKVALASLSTALIASCLPVKAQSYGPYAKDVRFFTRVNSARKQTHQRWK